MATPTLLRGARILEERLGAIDLAVFDQYIRDMTPYQHIDSVIGAAYIEVRNDMDVEVLQVCRRIYKRLATILTSKSAVEIHGLAKLSRKLALLQNRIDRHVYALDT